MIIFLAQGATCAHFYGHEQRATSNDCATVKSHVLALKVCFAHISVLASQRNVHDSLLRSTFVLWKSSRAKTCRNYGYSPLSRRRSTREFRRKICSLLLQLMVKTPVCWRLAALCISSGRFGTDPVSENPNYQARNTPNFRGYDLASQIPFLVPFPDSDYTSFRAFFRVTLLCLTVSDY